MMNTSNIVIMRSFLVLVLLVIYSAFAHANITSCNGGSTSAIGINYGKINVPPDAAIGDVIASSDEPGASGAITTTFGPWTLYYKYQSATPGAYHAIPTNLKGIGVRAYVPEMSNSWFPWQHTGSCKGLISCTGPVPYELTPQTFELVKTADVVDSGDLSGEVFAYIQCDNGQKMDTFAFRNSSIVSTTCNLEQTSLTVDLGEYKTSDFSSTGSTTEKKQFSIPVHCSGNGVEFFLKVSSATIADNKKGVIALEPGGAGGIGVQLLKSDGSTPAPLDATKWDVGPGAKGENGITLYARYYQLQDKVTSGEANALATLTFSYK